ncbi:LamG domain-containing protein [Chloroflexi bacterium TSY]|nr:LamG domain-containing protein [Chloroflexi bacterium TSY]
MARYTNTLIRLILCLSFLLTGSVVQSPTVEASGCTVSPSGLISWWPGDGSAQDVHGSHHGTLKNGATFAPGLRNQAFNFDGIDDFVDFGEPEPLKLLGSDPTSGTNATISFWVKSNGSSSGGALIYKHDSNSPDNGYRINFSLGKIFASFENNRNGNTGLDGVKTSAQFDNERWHHVAAIFYADAARPMDLYVDGQLVSVMRLGDAGLSSIGDTTNPRQNLWFGSSGYPGEFFNGRLDEVQIFERALLPVEILCITDSDGDGLVDGAEVDLHMTNPDDPDGDDDGLTDGEEINIHSTDPNNPDSDGDGMSDGWEILFSLNPHDPSDATADPDGDTLTNLQEYLGGTDPTNPDSDGDGLPDGIDPIHNSLDAADGNPRDALFVDNEGRVGIGTTNPHTNLHVFSASTPTTITLGTGVKPDPRNAFWSYDGVDIAFGTPILDNLSFVTQNTTRMRILGNGNVGIGTMNPTRPLDVNGSAQIFGQNPYLQLKPSGWSAPGYLQYGVDSDFSQPGNYGGLFLPQGKNFIVKTDGGKFVINHDGNVGVGTLHPSVNLQVDGGNVDGLVYPLKVSNSHYNSGQVGIVFLAGGAGGDRGKGAIVYDNSLNWNRGDFHFLQNRSADESIPTMADSVLGQSKK